MDKIRIRGGRPLTGTIAVGGAKNAALPLMAASILIDATLTLAAGCLRRRRGSPARSSVRPVRGWPRTARSALDRGFWEFYMNANGAFWSSIFYGTEVAIPVWPYPVQLATFLSGSRLVQFLVISAVAFWWIGWSGTVFLSSTRVIFAAALDRMLPEWVSKIETRTKTPINALLLMVIPSVIISILYAWNIVGMQTIVLDATPVIAITFFVIPRWVADMKELPYRETRLVR